MLIVKKESNRIYTLIQIVTLPHEFMGMTTEEKILSKLYPSNSNKRQYEALTYGHYTRFKTVKEWLKWINKEYGFYVYVPK